MGKESAVVSEWLEVWIQEAPTGRALDLGAGDGETSLWLAAQGFRVDAIERDAERYEFLAKASIGHNIEPNMDDVTNLALPKNIYSLIVAHAILHFLRPTDLWPFADRLSESLNPGGLLFAEVFTTDDPGCVTLQESSAREIEPNTYLASQPSDIIHYFAPGELRRTFAMLETLAYEEARYSDPKSPEGYRAGAVLVARQSRG
jgi:cyclopropane fatty-acyl-phospholipid synthase-like methyltransferase